MILPLLVDRVHAGPPPRAARLPLLITTASLDGRFTGVNVAVPLTAPVQSTCYITAWGARSVQANPHVLYAKATFIPSPSLTVCIRASPTATLTAASVIGWPASSASTLTRYESRRNFGW